jgi:hypothetical protein
MIPQSWSTLSSTIYSLRVASNAELCGPLPSGLDPNTIQLGNDTQLQQQCYWQPDADILMAFKASVADPDDDLITWQAGSNPCGPSPWRWIVCEHGWVVGLHLQGTSVAGPLASQLVFLHKLRSVVLSSNKLTGEGWPGMLRWLMADRRYGLGSLSEHKPLTAAGGGQTNPWPPLLHTWMIMAAARPQCNPTGTIYTGLTTGLIVDHSDHT